MTRIIDCLFKKYPRETIACLSGGVIVFCAYTFWLMFYQSCNPITDIGKIYPSAGTEFSKIDSHREKKKAFDEDLLIEMREKKECLEAKQAVQNCVHYLDFQHHKFTKD